MATPDPALPTPALDFLRKVQVWQDAPGGTAGLAVLMPDRETATLEQILEQARKPDAPVSWLEAWARNWLIGYREMNPPLTREQAGELDAVISRSAGLSHAQPRPRQRPRQRLSRKFWLTAASVAGAAVVAAALIDSAHEGGNPAQPPGAAQPLPGVFQPPPPAATPLQQFERDWDIPAVAQADAGNPRALVLLMNSLYYPSGWSVPADDPAWSPDTGGHVVQPARVAGGQVTFTDADGNSWTVGVRQPFTEASDPGTVLEFDPSGDARTMPASHAIVIRHRT